MPPNPAIVEYLDVLPFWQQQLVCRAGFGELYI